MGRVRLMWRRGAIGVVAVLILVAGLLAAVLSSTRTSPAQAIGDPVIAAAGDISCDPLNRGYNGGNGTATDCREKYTAALLTGVDKVLALGDQQYACGGLTAFNQAYDPTWGALKSITRPVPGNHEYQTSGGTGCSTNASGYYTYFGALAGDPTTGYYSYDLGSWHLIALNSECAAVGGCSLGSRQEVWLRNDLAAHASAPCTLAYWHRPRFGSSSGGGDGTYGPFWQDLYTAHADVVLVAHDHWYERFALQNSSGQADPNGIREFIVGTGGESYVAPANTRAANSEVLNWGQSAYGVLKMTLHPGSYDWTFVPDTGTFSDTGSNGCHNAASGSPSPSTSPSPTGDTTPPVTSANCNGSACSTGWYRTTPVTVTLSATDDQSGVASTYFTTDGSTPTQASARYVDPITVAVTTTVKYFSVDVANNAEQVRTVLVSVDADSPTVSMTSPADGSTYGRGTKVPLAASAADVGTGSGSASGVASVGFYVDGTLLTVVTSAPYQYNWNPKNLRGAHTLTAVATDVAGNARTSNSVVVTLR